MGPRSLPLALSIAVLLGAGACAPQRAEPRTAGSVSSSDPSAPPARATPKSAPERVEASPAYREEPETIDDEVGAEPPGLGEAPTHPLDGWSREELDRAARDDLASLGPISIGRPNAGALLNGVRMPEGAGWELVDPAHAWGTAETVDALVRSIEKVRDESPDGPPLYIGHISARNGGPLRPHRSHQSGRDVDVSYFYLEGQRWFARATAKNLDTTRTWALVRALVTESDVEMLLIDANVQRLLREHAERIGEDSTWLRGLFEGIPGRAPPIIRHARGHATHIHIRFFSPVAQETARRVGPALAKQGKAAPDYVLHTARKGDTLGSLARRYGTSVRAIQRANNLRSTMIVAKRTYRIPRQGAAVTPAASTGVRVPPRRIPPKRAGPRPHAAATDAGGGRAERAGEHDDSE